ncbi:integrase zinc binding domain-containing protein [Kitasatospora kifunensis]|uniref:Uncharacterized protein n=1 Tax=Kitasatospora kifunensis TaxID=58351 RepID=A0A7W7R8Y5_KITKI|nr:integrase zinc binding domain-containing protein [Kitasatospora kifunensis]MBB4927455.1 hypothetical protein [Kitasatospora kifunensis]
MSPRREPIAPAGPRMRDYTESQVTMLIRELHELGGHFGILWGSARTNGEVDGHILVDFGNAPVSTLLNLLHLLRDAEASQARDS